MADLLLPGIKLPVQLQDNSLVVRKKIARSDRLHRMDRDTTTDRRHQGIPFPDCIDRRVDSFGNRIDVERKLLFLSETALVPANLAIEILLLHVSCGDRHVNQVTQLGIDR